MPRTQPRRDTRRSSTWWAATPSGPRRRWCRVDEPRHRDVEPVTQLEVVEHAHDGGWRATGGSEDRANLRAPQRGKTCPFMPDPALYPAGFPSLFRRCLGVQVPPFAPTQLLELLASFGWSY